MKELLLLHGAIGAASQFEDLRTKLADSYNVHLVNFSGHGGAPMAEFSIKKFSEDVLDYLNQKGIDKIDVFGYSMGGYVALSLAEEHPGIIGNIFTLATKFHWTEDIAERETKMLDAEVISAKVPTFAKQLEARHYPNNWKEVLSKTSDMMRSLSCSPIGFNAISNRVRIAIGDRDMMVTLDETVDAFRKLQDGSLLVIPETPHPFEKVDTERLLTELKAFFK